MTRVRTALYVGGGLLAYGVALVATLPAPWVAHTVESVSQQRLVLRDPSGTAWAGSGRLYARKRSGELLELGALDWRLSPSSLLVGKLGADLRFGNAARPAQLEMSAGSIAVQGLDVQVPGAAVAAFVPALETFGPQGTVRIRTAELRVDRDSVLGHADVEWRNLRLARQDLALGTHVARVRAAGAKADIELATLEGPLELRGAGTWGRDAGVSLGGTVVPRSTDVVPFLQSVCAEYRDSSCRFRYAASRD